MVKYVAILHKETDELVGSTEVPDSNILKQHALEVIRILTEAFGQFKKTLFILSYQLKNEEKKLNINS